MNNKVLSENHKNEMITDVVDTQIDLNNFEELPKEKTTNLRNSNKGRKLTVKESTFCIDEGTYSAVITDAFWYKTEEDKDRVMLIFELEDGTEFKNSVDGDWIERYPFSRLISQTDANYVEDFVDHRVKFTIRNYEGDAVTFSNIKRISIDQ